jgi:putative aldouronate transport system permease protein
MSKSDTKLLQKKKKWTSSQWTLFIMAMLGVAFLLVFSYAPMYGIVLAFKKGDYVIDIKKAIFQSDWIGLENFKKFLVDPQFFNVVINTLCLNLLSLLISFPAPIIFALLINEVRGKAFKKTVQTISYLPYFISWVVVSNIVYLLLSANGGILNNLLVKLGLEKIKFYSEPKYWWGILTSTALWKGVGWGTIVYLAAITAINPDLYEAAEIDGANAWRKIWAVTIPGMMPVIGIQLILSAGNLIKDDFDQIYSLVGGENYELRPVTEVFSSLVFRNLQGGPKGFSASTAISLVQSLMSLGLVLAADAIVRKTDNPGLW